MSIRGRDLVTGLPKNIVVNSAQIRQAMKEPLEQVLAAVKETLENTPPELSADIIDHGIMLTGGGALIHGLDRKIAEETGIPVHIAKDPLDCVSLGTGLTLENPHLWETLSNN